MIGRADRLAAAAPHVAKLYQDLAALERRGLDSLFVSGFELPPRRWIAPDDIDAWRAWDGECIDAARQWLQRQSPRLQVDEAAVELLSCAHQLRRAVESEVIEDIAHVLKWAWIAQNGRALGYAELLFTEATDGLFVVAERAERARQRRSEVRKLQNENQSGWHEYAFGLIAAQSFVDPSMAPKRLYFWVAGQVNKRQQELGLKLVKEAAIEKAVRRKRALFEEIREDVQRDVAKAMSEASKGPSALNDV